jgi:hypothetical protein
MGLSKQAMVGSTVDGRMVWGTVGFPVELHCHHGRDFCKCRILNSPELKMCRRNTRISVLPHNSFHPRTGAMHNPNIYPVASEELEEIGKDSDSSLF